MPLNRMGEEVPHPVDRVIVFAGSTMEADLVKLHLLESGIEALLEDEYIGTTAPYTVTGGAGAVKVTVSVVDEPEARELIERHQRKR